MMLNVYNTLSRTKQVFEPLVDNKVSIYVCGPTVYDKAHVGHGMSSLVFDIIRRFLEYRGFEVEHVMNYTDVDDKVIIRAAELDVDPIELSNRYILEYEEHLKALNILPAAAFPRVSEEIDHIIELIQGLVETDYAYESDGSVYFRVAKDEDYGKLSGRKLEEMQAGARVEVDETKDDPADFALWKAEKPGEPAWESPWGRGRPGWHIECSAMSHHYLGEQIDIHGGGNDLVFPHHENEIAQTESLTGKPFATYWMHNGMLQFTGEKMSKSLGNVVTLEAFLQENSGDVLRITVLNSHYRKPLVFNEDIIAQSRSALARLKAGMKPVEAPAKEESTAAQSLAESTASARQGFEASMEDDFNTPGALGHLFELTRSINQARGAGASVEIIQDAQAALSEMAAVLGLNLVAEDAMDVSTTALLDLLVEIREELRKEKLFELSDLIRDRLEEQGITLEDGKGGTSWVRSE